MFTRCSPAYGRKSMFKLDSAIAEWRRQMAEAGVTTGEVLDELESHLRDELEEQLRLGKDAQEAFEAAALQIGQAKMLRHEFAKVGQGTQDWIRQTLLTLAGIPNHSFTTSMNTSYIEPRWATY